MTWNEANTLHNSIIGYRSIGFGEFYYLIEKAQTIKGKTDLSSMEGSSSNLKDVICFYESPNFWKDDEHVFFIQCRFNKQEIIDYGSGNYLVNKDFEKKHIWNGKDNNKQFAIDIDIPEFYVSSYSYNNVEAIISLDNYTGIDSNRFGALKALNPFEYREKVYKQLTENLNIPIISLKNIKNDLLESDNIYESRSYTPNQLKKMMYNREYKSQNPYKDKLYHGYADEFANKMVNNFSEEDWKYAADWANSLEFPLKVYRGIQVKSKEDIRFDKLGNHWTTDPEMFNNRSTIGVSKMNYILSGYVDEKDIDWAKTMDNFMYYSINSQNKRYGAYPENEIYVRSSAKVKDLEIEERV